jgi:hypothetical protein
MNGRREARRSFNPAHFSVASRKSGVRPSLRNLDGGAKFLPVFWAARPRADLLHVAKVVGSRREFVQRAMTKSDNPDAIGISNPNPRKSRAVAQTASVCRALAAVL